MAARKNPPVQGPTGKFVPQVDAADRRREAALARSRGAGWQEIADQHYNGDIRNASAAVKQFWAEQPRETVEEIRTAMLAKLDGLEETVRGVMARRHYVIAEGHVVRLHGEDCTGGPRCGCPVLEDGKPIYDGVNAVRALVETQLKLIPGLAAPKRVEMLDDDAIRAEIDKARAELEAEAERLAAHRIADRAAAGLPAGIAGDEEESG